MTTEPTAPKMSDEERIIYNEELLKGETPTQAAITVLADRMHKSAVREVFREIQKK